METRGLTFPETVELLAEKFNIPIIRTGKLTERSKEKDYKKPLYRINELAEEFFSERIKNRDPVVVEYVLKRGLTRATFQEFRVGFASSGNELLTFLKSKKVPEDLLIRSGLIKRNDRGQLYDALRNRLTFPIFIDKKKIAGFGGRIIPGLLKGDESPPKYLNSPESDIYQKSTILYGLPHATDAIRAAGEVYVVEGYLDVIGLHQGEVKNCVATCGTSLTVEHVKKLSRLAKKVTMLFDGDSAGRNAAGKSFKHFANSPIDVWAVYLPEKEDPDSLAKAYGAKTKEFLDAQRRIPLVDAFIDYLTHEQKAKSVAELGSQGISKIADAVMEVLHAVENKTVFEDLIRRAAHRLGVTEAVLRSIKPKKINQSTQLQSNEPSISGNAQDTHQDQVGDMQISDSIIMKNIGELPPVDREVLKLAIGRKDTYLDIFLRDAVVFPSLQQTSQQFLIALSEVLKIKSSDEDKKNHLKSLLTTFGASWTKFWKEAHRAYGEPTVNTEKTYQDIRTGLERNARQLTIESLSRQAGMTQDGEEKARLLQQVIELRRN